VRMLALQELCWVRRSGHVRSTGWPAGLACLRTSQTTRLPASKRIGKMLASPSSPGEQVHCYAAPQLRTDYSLRSRYITASQESRSGHSSSLAQYQYGRVKAWYPSFLPMGTQQGNSERGGEGEAMIRRQLSACRARARATKHSPSEHHGVPGQTNPPQRPAYGASGISGCGGTPAAAGKKQARVLCMA
jgi:hypothetical protein